MTAVSIEEVDKALALKYAGITILGGSPPAAIPVSVFIEVPSPEETVERTYPSVCLQFLSVRYDTTRAHTDDDNQEEMDYDSGASPPVRTMRDRPLPYILVYSVDTWHRVYAKEERDLVYEAIIKRTHPRGSMNVVGVDGGTESVWVLWDGNSVPLHEDEKDYMIYHRNLTLEIPVYLLVNEAETEVKVVTEAITRFYGLKTQVAVGGLEVEVVDGSKTLFSSIRVTDTVMEPE